jgi:hypothetical protein
MANYFPIPRFYCRPINNEIGGTPCLIQEVKVEKPIRFDEQIFQKTLIKYGVEKYKKQFKTAWEELSKR